MKMRAKISLLYSLSRHLDSMHIFLWLLLSAIPLFGQDDQFTGYAKATINNGLTSYETSGYMDRERGIAYDTATIQPVGSVSKLIIGLAIAKASEMGLVDIDADIREYIDLHIYNPNLKRGSSLTLRHLATHTSGILDREKAYFESYSRLPVATESLEDFLRSYLLLDGKRYSRKNFGKYPPGKEYNYSNIGAALAAFVIQEATGVPFDNFTETHIFRPLGMHSTHWHYNMRYVDAYAQLYDENDDPLDRYALATWPDGGLKTTVSDLSRLLQALMEGYRGGSGLLGKESWNLFFAPNFSSTTVRGVNPREPESGLFITYTPGGALGHSGSDPGVSAMVFFNPEKGLGKVFMANEDITPDNLETFQKIWRKE